MSKSEVREERKPEPREVERIPFLTGRPDRMKAIGKDDVLNLRIALNTCDSLDELLEAV